MTVCRRTSSIKDKVIIGKSLPAALEVVNAWHVCVALCRWTDGSAADGEESTGWGGREGQRSEDEDQPVHPAVAREGGGQETGGAAHLPGAGL